MPRGYRILTVTGAASSFDLTTLANLKDDLGITGAAEDTYLARAITQASSAVADYCNRVFAQQTYQVVIRPERDARPWAFPNGHDPFLLAPPPLVSVTSVDEDGTALVSGTDYEAALGDQPAIYRLNASGDPKDWPSVKITVVYVAGYVLPGNTGATLPAAIEDATIRLVKGRRLARSRDPYLRVDDVSGIGRQEFWIPNGPDAGNMPPDVAEVLDKYRIPALV